MQAAGAGIGQKDFLTGLGCPSATGPKSRSVWRKDASGAGGPMVYVTVEDAPPPGTGLTTCTVTVAGLSGASLLTSRTSILVLE